ncbi:MAG TPA: hypothetical protein VGR29_12690 [Thermomicrobiales bacterium]|nr:hypothetical protein [Thermomicrobiales bacterium]
MIVKSAVSRLTPTRSQYVRSAKLDDSVLLLIEPCIDLSECCLSRSAFGFYPGDLSLDQLPRKTVIFSFGIATHKALPLLLHLVKHPCRGFTTVLEGGVWTILSAAFYFGDDR